MLLGGSLLRTGLVVAAAAMLAATSGFAAETLIAEKDGVRVSLVPALAPATVAEQSTKSVTLDIEASTDEAVTRVGGRSVLARVSIDCSQPANRFDAVTAYPQPELQGDGAARRVSGAWIKPSPDSVMLDVVRRICASAPPAGPPIAVRAAPPAPAASSPPAPAADGAPTVPAAQPPVAVAMPPPAPQAQASAAAETPRPLVKRAPAAKPSPPAVPGVAPSGIIAQVAASPTAKGAQRVLDELKSLIAAPLAGAVEPAVVQGVQVYRASVSGFTSVADANAFCAKAKDIAKACWVRPPPRKPA